MKRALQHLAASRPGSAAGLAVCTSRLSSKGLPGQAQSSSFAPPSTAQVGRVEQSGRATCGSSAVIGASEANRRARATAGWTDQSGWRLLGPAPRVAGHSYSATRSCHSALRGAALAKGVLARVGDVQEVVLILVVSIHIRHQRSCSQDRTGGRAGSPC